MIYGHIVGIDEPENGERQIRVMLSHYDSNAKNKWEFNRNSLTEKSLMNLIKAGKVDMRNAKIDEVTHRLVGKTGALSRFNSSKGFHPVVVIAEIRVKDDDESGRLVGYTIARYDGTIKNIKLSDMLNYCDKVTEMSTKENPMYPVQNMMYVAGENKAASLRAYVDGQNIIDYITVGKINTAKPSKVDLSENEKNTSNEKYFTQEQLEQLRLGKQHGVDIRVYGNSKLSAEQMKALREGLESGVDVTTFAGPEFKPEAMKAYIFHSKYNIDVSQFVNSEYSVGQIFTLSSALLDGLDISRIADPKMSSAQMGNICSSMEAELYRNLQISVMRLIDEYPTE